MYNGNWNMVEMLSPASNWPIGHGTLLLFLAADDVGKQLLKIEARPGCNADLIVTCLDHKISFFYECAGGCGKLHVYLNVCQTHMIKTRVAGTIGYSTTVPVETHII